MMLNKNKNMKKKKMIANSSRHTHKQIHTTKMEYFIKIIHFIAKYTKIFEDKYDNHPTMGH